MFDLDGYLVKLGFKVDVVALDSFLNVLDKAKTSMHKTDFDVKKTALQMAGGYAKIIATVAIGIGKMVTAVAEADQQLGITARKYWMTKENFTELSYAAEALGYSIENINDITLDPELLSQYRELLNVSKQLQPSSEQLSYLRNVRGVMYEVKEFMLGIRYLVMNISASLAKYLTPETNDLRNAMQDINYWLEDMMPEITDALTNIIGPMMRILLDVLTGALKIVRMLLPYVLRLFSIIGKIFKALEPIWRILEHIIDVVVVAASSLKPIFEFLLNVLSDVADILDAITDPVKKLSDIKLFSSTRDFMTGASTASEAAMGSTTWYTGAMENNKSITTNNYDTSRKTVSVTNNNNIYAQDATGVATQIAKKSEVYLNRYAY